MNVYLVTHNGKSCRLTEEERESLIERFDPEKPIVNRCPLCEKYFNNGCEKCPISVFERNVTFGCVVLAKHILRDWCWITGHTLDIIATEKRGDWRNEALTITKWFKTLQKWEVYDESN